MPLRKKTALYMYFSLTLAQREGGVAPITSAPFGNLRRGVGMSSTVTSFDAEKGSTAGAPAHFLNVNPDAVIYVSLLKRGATEISMGVLSASREVSTWGGWRGGGRFRSTAILEKKSARRVRKTELRTRAFIRATPHFATPA